MHFPYRIVFDVILYSNQKNYRMVHFVLNEFFTDDTILVLQNVSKNIFKQPFRLMVNVHCYRPPRLRVREGIFFGDEEDNETESEDDETDSEDEEEDESVAPTLPTLPTLQDHFKTDQCVICMEKEPCILFTPCRHICVCVSCDALKPSYKCSCCRTRISQKIKL